MADTDAFLRAALIPRNTSHSSGTLDEADALLADSPELRNANIFTAAVLGDAETVSTLIAEDATAAVSRGGPYDWDVLTHLCFSRYLQHRPHDGFSACVRTLLDAGASANSGFFEKAHEPNPEEWESVLYGAAGVAHNPEVTQLLVDAGADVNDGEVPYHTPESYDNRAMQIIVNSGRMEQSNLQMMLIRKCDWHDYEGGKWLLEHGADGNSAWGKAVRPFHFSILRDNRIEMIEMLLDHGADPFVTIDVKRFHGEARENVNGIEVAARCGRKDVLELLRSRGFNIETNGMSGLLVACALGDTATARKMIDEDPTLLDKLREDQAMLLMRYGLTGNTEGLLTLLDLGLDINAATDVGDGYWTIAKKSTALHAAAWRAKHDAVKQLIRVGADVNQKDGQDRTPLMLAVKATVDSWWTDRRSPESVQALLDAGASTDGVDRPVAYDEVEALLASAADSGS